MGGLLGAFAGFVASMWGGIEVFLPVFTIAGAMLGISLAYIIELIILAIY